MGTNKSKKQKRLDKYIEKKLKKERRVELFELLSKSAYKSDLMKSSRTLGQNNETKREKLRRAALEEKHGIARSDPSVRLYVEKEVRDYEDDESPSSSDDDDDDYNSQETSGVKRKAESITKTANSTTTAAIQVGIDTGLVRRKRQKKNRVLDKLRNSGKDNSDSQDDQEDNSNIQTYIPVASIKTTTNEAEEEQDSDQSSEFDSSDSEDDGSESKDSQDSDENGSDSEEDQNQKDEEEPKKPKEPYKLRTSVLLKPGQISASAQHQALKEDKKFYITVSRTEEIQAQRLKLPIVAEEQRIMEAISENPVIILCGETGSGKTTQVPQFLYEAGYGHPESPNNPGMIGVTQPRRVAAVSMANRVSTELNLIDNEKATSSLVSYQIRYDSSTTSKDTRIKFMTDGVLLRELAQDFLLTKYSAIIVDEAHERSINTDILLGVLSRVVKLRQDMSRNNEAVKKSSTTSNNSSRSSSSEQLNTQQKIRPLKLIIMSATLRVDDFISNARLFDIPPPVIKVDARQFPVYIHYNRKTPLGEGEYIQETIRKVGKIHTRLPPGGILVFLSGQAEINQVCKALRKKWGKSLDNLLTAPKDKNNKENMGRGKKNQKNKRGNNGGDGDEKINPNEGMVELEDIELGEVSDNDQFEYDSGLEDSGDEDSEEENIEQLRQDNQVEDESGESNSQVKDTVSLFNKNTQEDTSKGGEEEKETPPLYVLPLYSLLPTEKQMQVFADPPPGSRLCVIATNVAETSLTIPGIKYVVDSGKVKARKYDDKSGVQSYEVEWVSRASADQRAGRAGRTGPGHCYRLYSSPIYHDHFMAFSVPEILRMPIEGLVLQMKSMHLDQIVNFPFPTAPQREVLAKSQRLLGWLGALEAGNDAAVAVSSGSVKKKDENKQKITELGRLMSVFPIAPRFSKMLIIGQQHGCLPYIIAIVSGLSVGDPFIRDYHMQFASAGGRNSKNTTGDDYDDNDEDTKRAGSRGGKLSNEEIAEKENFKAMRSKFMKSQMMLMGNNCLSDALKVLNAIGAYEYSGGTEEICQQYFLRSKAMAETRKLRSQLTHLVQANCPGIDVAMNPKMQPPSPKQATVLRQVILAGFIDQVAIRIDLAGPTSMTEAVMQQQNELAQSASYGGGGKSAKSLLSGAYITMWSDELVFIHPESVAHKNQSIKSGSGAGVWPDAVVYTELQRTSRLYMKGVTVIDPRWLVAIGRGLCEFGKPRAHPAPIYNKNRDEMECYVDATFGLKEWPIPPVKVLQKRVGTRWAISRVMQ
ncbi:putative ATP-dependent RNA helicase DHR1 [Mycoemilia scoparia]|uniref:RNA helicase n=1 Tax=Mycoemilia scoparia TaxID=417184 RepID=A0A9W8DQ76_9FUNG|nr:putative ATP-dependent RNA helicase DHR1 [Mycoemilia scoparia]